MIDRPTSEYHEGPTPNGGAFSIAYYRDGRGRPCGRDDALVVVVVDFDRAGREIHRTRHESVATR